MTVSLKSFRSAVALLKKQGLLRGRVDARSVTPETKIGRFHASTIVNRYDAIVSGKATAIKVPKKTLRAFSRKPGYGTANGRLIVPHAATEKVKRQGENFAVRSANGSERVKIPVPFKNLRQYLRDMRKNETEINRMKRDNEYFGIRLFGNHRANFYGDIDMLIDDLEKYEIVTGSSRYDQIEAFENLEILRISPKGFKKWENTAGAGKIRTSREYFRKRSRKNRAKLKRSDVYLDKEAARKRKYRAKLSGSKLEAYRKAARKRAKLSKKRRKKAQNANRRTRSRN